MLDINLFLLILLINQIVNIGHLIILFGFISLKVEDETGAICSWNIDVLILGKMIKLFIIFLFQHYSNNIIKHNKHQI